MSGIMMALLGGGSGVVIPGPSISDSRSILSPGTATSSVQWNTDGTIAPLNGPSRAWFNPPAVSTPGTSYYIKATVVSGALTGGSATGSYLSLASNRFWSVTRSTVGTNSAVLTVVIATSPNDADIVTSSTVDLTATVTV